MLARVILMFVILTFAGFFGFKAYKALRLKDRRLVRRDAVKNAAILIVCALVSMCVIAVATLADQL
ncbi:hypothetical protein [Burkholderia phage BCSR5]|nr:hypothetical protein [Burkholderia phage BCSR5]